MSGILGQSQPTAETILYKAPVDKYASCSLFVTNTHASNADTYDVAVRDYDRAVTLASSTRNDGDFSNVTGKILSNVVAKLTTSGGDINADFSAGDTVTFLGSGGSTPTGVTAKVAKVFEAYNVVNYTLDQRTVDVIEVSSFTAGDIALDDQLTDGTDNGTVKGISDPGGGADITLVVEMTSGNFTAAESLDNTTQGSTGVTTVSSVTEAGASALFISDTNELLSGISAGDGTLLVFDVSDASITNGFDIYTDSGLQSEDLEDVYTLRFGTVGTNGTVYLPIDTGSSDTYYFGDSNQSGNISTSIDTTATAHWTGTNNALLLYDLVGGSINVNDDISANSNTFTVSETDGSVSARTIGKFAESTNVLKVLEYDYINNPVTENTLLYNDSNENFAVAAAVATVSAESYIRRTDAISAATSEKISGVILGPESSVVVNTANSTTSLTLLGFEEAL